MADSGIKKVSIPRDSVGNLGKNNTHLLRYRVVSEDKNRFSAWSPIYNISGTNVVSVDGEVQVIGNIVFVSWGDEVLRPGYDVFVGYGTSKPDYHGTTPIHSYSFLKLGSTPRVIVQVQSMFNPDGVTKNLDDTLEIYDSGEADEIEGAPY
ncbi:MAG: hypothetical protein WCI60_03740 [bacterium]